MLLSPLIVYYYTTFSGYKDRNNPRNLQGFRGLFLRSVKITIRLWFHLAYQ